MKRNEVQRTILNNWDEQTRQQAMRYVKHQSRTRWYVGDEQRPKSDVLDLLADTSKAVTVTILHLGIGSEAYVKAYDVID